MRLSSAALFLTLLAVGCGGNSGSSKSSSTSAASTSSTSTVGSSSTGGVTSSSTPAFQLVGFETIDVGDGSPRGFNQGAHETHVASDADWASFWPTHSSATLPSVDFANESVVGTFLGPISGQQHRTRLINVSRDANSDDLHAVVREFRLGPWKPNTRILTSPFHLVRCETPVSGQGTLTIDRQTELDFETLLSGSDSALGANDPTYTGGLHVARDAAAFNALFAQIRPSSRPPAVDFTTQMVVAVLGPYVGSFGNSVETLRLVHDPSSDEVRVISRVNPYRGGAAPPPATETPFQLLRVTRATGAVRAEQTAPVTQTRLAAGESPLYTGGSERLLVRDAATFATVWSARIGGAVPVVDFTQDQVLMAFEAPGSGLTVSVARSLSLEDDELAVTVNTQLQFGTPARSAAYSVVTTPKTYGPVSFETIDVTPRP